VNVGPGLEALMFQTDGFPPRKAELSPDPKAMADIARTRENLESYFREVKKIVF
jgi:hypothetical protein